MFLGLIGMTLGIIALCRIAIRRRRDRRNRDVLPPDWRDWEAEYQNRRAHGDHPSDPT
jgi:hypothetical protein